MTKILELSSKKITEKLLLKENKNLFLNIVCMV